MSQDRHEWFQYDYLDLDWLYSLRLWISNSGQIGHEIKWRIGDPDE